MRQHVADTMGIAMQHLVIVTTGGTIDKIYFDDKSTFQIGEPQIGDILQALGVAFTFDVVPVLRKDSLHIAAQSALQSSSSRIGMCWSRTAPTRWSRPRRHWRDSPARSSC
jgi:L-asparaginase/Glu-tRNA(Gln) amidotransferase subunit D